MSSLVDRIVCATPSVACFFLAALIVCAVVHAETPGIVVIEAPVGIPGDLDQLVSKATVPPTSPVSYEAPSPATSWDIFKNVDTKSGQQPKSTPGKTKGHPHDHEMFGTCESCLEFERSRQEMLARAFDRVIARFEEEAAVQLNNVTSDQPPSAEIDVDDVDRIRIRPEQGNVTGNRAARSEEKEIMATFGPLSQVSINTHPKLDKSTELPPNLASNRYVSYEAALAYGGGAANPWPSRTFCWQAPSFYHRPLYFEQVNLERYGHYRKNWMIESILSAAHFFGTIPALPLQLGSYHPCERVYTLGRYRPGDCNPNHKYLVPITWHGILKQGLTTTALVFAL